MMHTGDMMRAFAPYREDALVVPGRGGRYWIDLTTKPGLDLALGDPAMGGHAGFALGLALARPEKKVILFDSEGDILMGLGMLVTIAEQQPANLYHFLIDNGCYATTGGQPVPNADNVAYDAIARGAGYPRALAFDELDRFSASLPEILNRPRPGIRRAESDAGDRKRSDRPAPPLADPPARSGHPRSAR